MAYLSGLVTNGKVNLFTFRWGPDKMCEYGDRSRVHLADVEQRWLELDTMNLAILWCRTLEPVQEETAQAWVKTRAERAIIRFN